ncbi:MAG TPA: hypothetical protein PLG05_05955 [Bacteroidales bacterium]|nr:hypothetical protein [Bacteroidales bacterium]HOR59742.1 hypothetical protein [Bacteroidales bacterium]HPL04701.1 hypothetical protein [Bacteroidales bacterium]
MKKALFLILLTAVFATAAFGQEQGIEINFDNDSVYVDTLNRNLIGLNVFPAFGILGGGRLPSTKVFIQYKHYYKHMNLRASLNYLNFDFNNDQLDVLGFTKDTVVTDTSTTVVDNMNFRKFYYNIYSYDARCGLEAAFPSKSYRFFIGAGAIIGYHYLGEYYYHYKKNFEGYPALNVNHTFVPVDIAGHRKTRFLKTGVDFTIGVDINITPSFIISVQYAPELNYYYRLSDDISDIDNCFKGEKVASTLTFVPDYIDLIFSIRF